MLKQQLNALVISMVLTMSPSYTLASDNSISIIEGVWSAFSSNEKDLLLERYSVKVISQGNIGYIVDVQEVNMSTTGSDTGSRLGGAYVRAAYLDAVYKNPPIYSAKTDLALTVAGSIVGGAIANTPPRSRFIIRYTVRTMDGKVYYNDVTQESPLRRSVGECVSLLGNTDFDQSICTQTVEAVRGKLFINNSKSRDALSKETPAGMVRCRFGKSSPVIVDRATCEKAQGEVINE